MPNEKSIADLQIMSGMKLIHDGCKMRGACVSGTRCPFRDFCSTAVNADWDLNAPLHWTDEYIFKGENNNG